MPIGALIVAGAIGGGSGEIGASGGCSIGEEQHVIGEQQELQQELQQGEQHLRRRGKSGR
jgi:hypothetical protein